MKTKLFYFDPELFYIQHPTEHNNDEDDDDKDDISTDDSRKWKQMRSWYDRCDFRSFVLYP